MGYLLVEREETLRREHGWKEGEKRGKPEESKREADLSPAFCTPQGSCQREDGPKNRTST